VVIGSGFAGLAAAIEAGSTGSSVIILEKMRRPGGNSIISDGMIAVAGSPLQANKGIQDSPELMYQDMLKAGLGLNHRDLARIVAENSLDLFLWTVDFLGIRYAETLDRLGGHSVPRTLTAFTERDLHPGSVMVRKMLAKLTELGMAVRTRSFLVRLLMDRAGRVEGVRIRYGHVFPNPESGTTRHIRARKAVVLTTGGFGSDVSFRAVQDPRLNGSIESTNRHSATAEALIEALRIGATPVQLSWIQLGPWSCPDEKGSGVGAIFATSSTFPYGLIVDPATGRRVVNELADRRTLSEAIMGTGRTCIGITDAAGAGYGQHVLDKCLKRGVVRSFPTLEGFASWYGIPSEDLRETVERYNRYVETRKDEEFGKPIIGDSRPLVDPPYYGIRLWPKVHYTMGGIQINTRAQAIGLDQRPIEGLYAAGEVTGGIHGACRLGSCAIPECLIFGRIAGSNAASEEPLG